MSKKNVLRAVLGCLILVLSFVGWYFLKKSFGINEEGEWIRRILYPSLSFCLLGMFVGLVYLIEDKKIFLMLLSLLLVPFFIFFSAKDGLIFFWSQIGITVLAVLFIIWGGFRVLNEKSLRIKLTPHVFLKKGLASIATALSLMAALAFYGSPTAQSFANQEIIVPRNMFDVIFNSVMVAPETLLNFSNDVKKAGLNQTIQQIPQQIRDSAFGEVNRYINNFGRPYKKFIPLGASLSFFFAVRFLGAILMRFSILFAWLGFELLRLLKIARIKTVEAQKEIIEI